MVNRFLATTLKSPEGKKKRRERGGNSSPQKAGPERKKGRKETGVELRKNGPPLDP